MSVILGLASREHNHRTTHTCEHSTNCMVPLTKNNTLRRFNVGPTSETLTSIKPAISQYHFFLAKYFTMPPQVHGAISAIAHHVQHTSTRVILDLITQQTRSISPMLGRRRRRQLTSKQHWGNASCLLGNRACSYVKPKTWRKPTITVYRFNQLGFQ